MGVGVNIVVGVVVVVFVVVEASIADVNSFKCRDVSTTTSVMCVNSLALG